MPKPIAWVRVHPGLSDARLAELRTWAIAQTKNELWANDLNAVAWLLAILTAIEEEQTRRLERQLELF